MPGTLQLETVLAAIYALGLLIIAAGLEYVARHSHKRADQYHTGGFRFHHERDLWECPMGAALIRAEIDFERNAIRYRAPAPVCNRCVIKSRCTSSNEGRELLVQLDPWVESAPLRLQRGISLVLAVLAAFLLTVELIRQRQHADQFVLSAALAIVLLRLMRTLRTVRGKQREDAHAGGA